MTNSTVNWLPNKVVSVEMASKEFIHTGIREKLGDYEGEISLVLANPPEEAWEGDTDYFKHWTTPPGLNWIHAAYQLVSTDGVVIIYANPERQRKIAALSRYWTASSATYIDWQTLDVDPRCFLAIAPYGVGDTSRKTSVEGSGEPVPTSVWRQIVETWTSPDDRVLDLFLRDATTVDAADERNFIGISHNQTQFEEAEKTYATDTTNALNW